MAFQGSLAELHLPDIIQLVSVSGKTGVFHLTDGALRGEIYLNEGRIVHAEMDEQRGEEAVYALAIWRQGEFRFDPGPPTEQQTITKSNTNLLMEAARRLDEWRVLSKKVPSVDLIPEFVVQENREGQINLNTVEWLILSKIDGNRSIKAIAAVANLSVFDAAKMLYGLIATGLIRLREAGGLPAPVPPTAPSAPNAAAGATAAFGSAPASGSAVVSKPPTPPPASGNRTEGPTATTGHTPPGGTPARAVTPNAAPAPPAAAPAAPSGPSAAELLAKLNRVRDACGALLGPVGESVVNKHYQKARGEIERGAGFEAVEEAANQIARAAAILKGPSAAESLIEQLRALK
jgi:hypothetical protein